MVPRKRTEIRMPNGVVIVKGAAPEAGTKLTPERLAENLRSLNQSWGKKEPLELQAAVMDDSLDHGVVSVTEIIWPSE